MASWGDFAIVAVRYDEDDSRIKEVRRMEVKPDKLVDSEARRRAMIVNDIEVKNVDYTTAIKNESGRWELGEEVDTYELGGETFIRTEPGDTPEDNLGGLPTF